MNELINDTGSGTYFLAPSAFSTAPADHVLANLVSALREAVSHPDPAFQHLAAETLDHIHQIQEQARRRLALQRRGLTVTRLAVIIETIELQFRFERGTLLGRRRTQRIAMARQLAMFLCRSLTSASYPIIAQAFNRDHSTAIWGADSIRCRMARDAAFRGFVQRLERQIGGDPVTQAAA